MSKIKQRLEDFQPDQRLVDERGPTKERIKQARGAWVVGDIGTITVRQSTVERALNRGIINEQQGRAAEKLYLHWFRGGLSGSFGKPSDWVGLYRGISDGFCGLPKTEMQVFDRQRFAAGLNSIINNVGSDAAQVIYLVVCQELPFEEAGRRIGYTGAKQAQTAAVVTTRYGLNVLVREWGIY